ncbi:hypothetical protein LTR12_012401 [Friedmanniomyces endolithicus]|nr:hypothetical protein LTR12_012401 [Friedmanniomyces endolithicus]
MSQQAVIGLIGGMSWESSAEYYRIINQVVRSRLGSLRSARCLMWSFDFGEIEALQHAGRWDDATALMIDAAKRLERGGADFFLICTNTMHLMADQVQSAVHIPLLHIADPTAERIKAQDIKRIGLLGTAFTMEQDFYKGRLQHRFGLDVLIPKADDRATVHRIIYDELVQGRAEPTSRSAYRIVIARLVERGAEAIILGCTEIMLLVKPEDSPVPLFDTTSIHAEAAVDRALSLVKWTEMYIRAREKAHTSTNVPSGRKATGFEPLSPFVVLDKHRLVAASPSLPPRTPGDPAGLEISMPDSSPPDGTKLSEATALFNAELDKFGPLISSAKRFGQRMTRALIRDMSNSKTYADLICVLDRCEHEHRLLYERE